MDDPSPISITIDYYALLRDQAGRANETLETSARTALSLYLECQKRYDFTLNPRTVRVVINEDFQTMNTPLNDGDHVVFIPPVAGG